MFSFSSFFLLHPSLTQLNAREIQCRKVQCLPREAGSWFVGHQQVRAAVVSPSKHHRIGRLEEEEGTRETMGTGNWEF